MSQALRTNFEEELCDLASFQQDQVKKMTDEEVGYYHWLYLEESVHDLM
ncbi:hypothetical protein [Sediminibacillus massiliensis]|nr:hypothetical protein [Sediminibacillus massiliensis]